MNPPILTVRAVAAIAAVEFGLSLAALLSSARVREIVRPRQAAMWLAKRHTTASLPEIGRRFGGFDHTTVLHAVRAIDDVVEKDADFAARLEVIGHRINAAEACASEELARFVRMTVQSPGADLPAEPARPEPLAIVSAPTQHQRRVLDAVGRYLEARRRVQRCLYTAGEGPARRDADSAFEALRKSYADEDIADRRQA